MYTRQPRSPAHATLARSAGMWCRRGAWLLMLLALTACAQTTVGTAARPIVWDTSVKHLVPQGHGGPHQVDFTTGRTAYRVLTGTGVRYDNNWAAISLAPDGTAYVGVLNGLARVRDGQLPTTPSEGFLVRAEPAARSF